MIQKKLIHYDIKGTNILFDTNKQVPLLIDFGLSIQVEKINVDKLKDIFYVYAPEYYIWSLEIHYLCYLLNKNKEPTIDELNSLLINRKTLRLIFPE